MSSTKRKRVKVKRKKKVKRSSGVQSGRRTGLGTGVRMLLWAFLVVASFTASLLLYFAWHSHYRQQPAQTPTESSSGPIPGTGPP